MKPYNTYRSIVFTLTTAFIFFFWDLISKIVQMNAVYGILLGGLISLGAYRLLLKVVEFTLLKIPLFKRLAFGDTYLEGVWIGCYIGFEDQPRLYIECFEQSFEGLVVRGRCYTLDYQFKGVWVSEKVIIDHDKGRLSYTYETDMVNSSHKNQGLAVFNFYRDKKDAAPYKMIGFSSDIYSPSKIKSIEVKTDYKKEMDDMILLEKAKAFYEENKNILGL